MGFITIGRQQNQKRDTTAVMPVFWLKWCEEDLDAAGCRRLRRALEVN